MSDAVSRPTAPRGATPLVGVWLIAVCVLVYAMILVGGATRLTDSGLSITEWKPISGVIPPLSDADWAHTFALYQQTTEYQHQNASMSLAEFRTLYWWEWGHRLLGRTTGLAIALPLLAFWRMGQLRGRLGRCLVLLALVGFEGVVGWWMVTSGLFSGLDVSPVRLAIHLSIAFVIIGYGLWLALVAFGWPAMPGSLGAPRWAPAAFLTVLLAQVILGALLAGADGGPAYPDWPTIGGHWIPPGLFELEPFARNFVANHAMQHFAHRGLGYVVAASALAIGFAAARAGRGSAQRAGLALGGLALAQASLGVIVVVSGAPVGLSLAHQAGAAALWLCAVATLKTSR